MRSWSFAAATPACVRDRRSASLHRRSSYRARPVPAEVSPLHASSARFRAPGAPVLPVALGEAGDAMPSNLYTARFFSQHPGPNVRFLKISATRLLQGLNCYAEPARSAAIWFSFECPRLHCFAQFSLVLRFTASMMSEVRCGWHFLRIFCCWCSGSSASRRLGYV